MKGAELAPRVEACCRFLREHELAAAVVVSPANMFYLTGMMLVPHERLAAVVVGVEGVLLLVLPELERERALEFVQPGQVLSWRDGENPITTLGNALRMLGLPSRVRLGVEKDSLTLALADGLRGEFPSIEFTDLSSLFSRLRAVKSPEEVERIRQACAITVSALQENLPWIRPGLTELEVAARLDLSLKMAGATGTAFGTQVLSGIRSALPHGQSSRKEIARGDVVVIDVGGVFGGYCGDLTRTVVVGKANHQDLEMHELVALAGQRAIATARAGVAAREVDRAARSVIEEAGYGSRFVHRTGHGLGIEVHEAPSLDGDNEQALQEGMVFTVEPGVYVPSWGGVRIEDVVVVTADGPQVLTEMSRDLITL